MLRDDDDNLKIKSVALIVIIIAAGIVGIVLLAISFKSIEYNEFALKQNTLSKEIDEEVYEEGLYFVGPFYDFIRFPSTWETIEFSSDKDAQAGKLSSQTEDGLAVKLEMSFQYRLRKKDVLKLYGEYGEKYEDYYAKFARGILRDIAAKYTALEYFYNRTAVGSSMEKALKDEEKVFVCELGEFQLRGIDLPDTFEDAVEDVEIAKQEMRQAEYEQQTAVIRAQTLIIEAQADYNITVIEANAYAEALDIRLTAEGEALSGLMMQLGFNSTEILTYLWIQAILEHDQAYLIIGQNTPELLLTLNNQSQS